MMLLNRIKSKQNFSDSELKIANYVNEFPQKVISMTIQELADVTYTSTSSVTRFCRKVDTEGFSELKLQLAKEINNFNLTDKRIEHDIPFQKEANQQEIAHNILNLNIQAILDTFSVLDLNQLERVAQQIVEARGIYFYGKGQSLILCEDFQYKLYRVGINALLTPASDYQIMQSMTQPEGSLAIVISYFGIGQTNQSVVKILNNK
ncbi:MurR/RpiR family transcriptional regulator [Fundicoccus culcitae]|uniref:MurR/RpiR family transcriptional regulator n=1 Tax=Fundicoccus culcitae TaxID=2969821 RepID=A0ABY5P9I0_9LACT|nr:MurR/RpiR family transcriptional regulator [Fundicoccus culcitae]UUX35411.1 MurR/RpiR family transcriptional regulator [Fundicoccus culcitae]